MSDEMSRNPIEKELLQSLRYGEGLDKEKLCELVALATKLFDAVERENDSEKATRAIKGYGPAWWWIYGQPAVKGIAVEKVLDHEQVVRLVSAVNKMADVKTVLSSFVLVPSGGAVSDPDPNPWKVGLAFGAKHESSPQPWKAGHVGGSHV